MRIAWTTALWISIALAVACSAATVDSPHPAAAGEDAGSSIVTLPDDPSGDGGAVDPSADGGLPFDGDVTVRDASASLDAAAAPPFDAGDGGVCVGAIAPGDLVVDELMIASVAGTGDHGEWLEVRSTVPCALDLRGLRGECPNGGHVYRFEVTDDVWIPPRGTFVVVDSSDPAINHGVPGVVVQWSGAPGDVLRNKGGTVTLRANGVIVDSVTYPETALTVGASRAFAADCPASARADFSRWQGSSASWFPSFIGTPNAPNADIHCN